MVLGGQDHDVTICVEHCKNIEECHSETPLGVRLPHEKPDSVDQHVGEEEVADLLENEGVVPAGSP